MKTLLLCCFSLVLASCASPSRQADPASELEYAKTLMAANMPDHAYQVIALAYSLPTSSDSLGNRLPLVTPETFDLGLILIDYMKAKGLFDEANIYANRHEGSDAVVYWGLQVHLNEGLYTRGCSEHVLHSYEQFLKAYQNKYIEK